MNKTIKLFSDSGHGWAEVSLSELKELNILDKITSYSYIFKNNAYLEEDCDLSTYIEALKENNIDFEFEDNYQGDNSPIRNYASYNSEIASILKGDKNGL